MAPSITDGTRMLIPLYHGTSTIFLPSIRESGLGAEDPNVEFRSYELLSELLETMKRHDWFGDQVLAAQEFMFQNMADQLVTGGGFNFRHGGTYLSPSRLTAIQYASANAYGSELLSNTVTLLEKLEKHDKSLSWRILKQYPNLSGLRELEKQPILIEVSQVPISSLRSENGRDAFITINEIQEFMSETDPRMLHILCQQCNFELVVPLPANMLNVITL